MAAIRPTRSTWWCRRCPAMAFPTRPTVRDFATRRRRVVGEADAGPRLSAVRAARWRLGRDRLHRPGDAPSRRGQRLSLEFPGRRVSRLRQPMRPRTEKAYFAARAAWYETEGAYGHEHGTKPQTLAYALMDFPSACRLDPGEVPHLERLPRRSGRAITMDDLLTNISIYWFTGTIASSIRLYKEMRRDPLRFAAGPRLCRRWRSRSSRWKSPVRQRAGGAVLQRPAMDGHAARRPLRRLGAAGAAGGGCAAVLPAAATSATAQCWPCAAGVLPKPLLTRLLASAYPRCRRSCTSRAIAAQGNRVNSGPAYALSRTGAFIVIASAAKQSPARGGSLWGIATSLRSSQ